MCLDGILFMKISINKEQWLRIGMKAGFIKEARRKDSLNRPLAYSEKYLLRKKVHRPDDPYFFGNGSIHAPEMVMLPQDAAKIPGDKLETMAYDWTLDWAAVPVKTPSPAVVFGLTPKESKKPKKPEKPEKVASQIPNTQNKDPDAENFAVDLAGRQRSIGSAKSRINKEIQALGNYFPQIPLSEIFAILKKYNVIPLQEDGTKWSGFVTSQGECGSDKASKQGPMKFELATLLNDEYVIANNVLMMTVCTMPSGKLEMIAYVS